jgi:lipoprotein-anchoring transpeptidase ErfK/SrfK
MFNRFSRRDFLKLLGTGMAGIVLHPDQFRLFMPQITFGRVTSTTLSVYEKPSDKSRIMFQRFLDDILNIYQEIESTEGPAYNPIWYRVWGGYVHSGFVQKVRYQLNPLMESFSSKGNLMELTIPYAQSYLLNRSGQWSRRYVLYYSSTHWVFSQVNGPDGQPWYEIRDGLVTVSYYVPGVFLRNIEDRELQPISASVEPRSKRIEISIQNQTLTAYEGDRIVKQARVSTGMHSSNPDPNMIPTDTPKGTFHIFSKRPSVHMGEGTLRADPEAYELPGVPWVSYFEGSTGVAIHGTFWHNNFGVQMSHGCINMLSEDAKWIYLWSTPSPPSVEDPVKIRTRVTVK